MHINFQFSTCLGSAPSPMCLQRVILESMRMLEVPERSFGRFRHGGCLKDTSRILQGSCISIFRSLPVWEVHHLLCVSRASSCSLKGRWRFLRGVLVVFEMVDAPRIHPGSYISIFKFLPSLKVVQLLGSPERHPSVILGVYEDAGGS